MTHRYYANLTIAIDTLSLNQYQSVKSILFNSFSALAFCKIPNQWEFAVEAYSRESAKEKITKTIAQIIATLDIPELMFTLFVSAEIVGIGTMRNKRIFSLKKATWKSPVSQIFLLTLRYNAQ